MPVDEEAVQRAWTRARDDLGISVIAPATVAVASQVIDAIALVPEFGARNGMVVFGRVPASERRLADESVLREGDYGFSYVSADYETYDRTLFIDTLSDWGWIGGAEPPGWYTGEPWG